MHTRTNRTLGTHAFPRWQQPGSFARRFVAPPEFGLHALNGRTAPTMDARTQEGRPESGLVIVGSKGTPYSHDLIGDKQDKGSRWSLVGVAGDAQDNANSKA